MADGETLTFTGELVTPDNVGIAEAWVTVTGLSDESDSMRARTDVEGRFRMANVPSGHYRIHAQALGHITWSIGPILLPVLFVVPKTRKQAFRADLMAVR